MTTTERFAAAHPVGDPDRGQVPWLLAFARPATTRLALSIAARLIHLCLGAALLALPAWAVGRLVAGHRDPASLVVTVIVVSVVMALVKAVLRYAEQLLGHLAAFGLMGEMRVWVLDHLTPQAPAALDGEGAGQVITVAHRDVERVEVFFAHTIAPAVTAVVVPLAAVVVGGLAAGWPAALALALVMAAGIALPYAGAAHGGRAARRIAAARSRITQEFADGVRAREEIAAFGAVDQRLDRLATLDGELEEAARGVGLRAGMRSAVTTLRVWGGAVLVLLVALTWPGSGAAAQGAVEALSGALLAAALVPGTATALDVVERLAVSLPAGLEATRRLRAMAAARPAVRDDATERDQVPSGAPRTGEVDSVSFSYPRRPGSGVTELDLHIAPGTTVALVGATGSGKSSVMRVLQRRWDVGAGSVRVDGTDVRDLPLQRTWREVVVADQSAVVLDATIRENLTLGAEHDEEDLWRVLRTACLDEVVRGLPQGLDTALGGRGVRLSGGQNQRLTLARALLRAGEDALLVLDEATSHQDAATQDALMANLAERRGGTVVIAHRLATVQGADEIVVLERGRAVERGTWAELTARQGAFAALLRGEG